MDFEAALLTTIETADRIARATDKLFDLTQSQIAELQDAITRQDEMISELRDEVHTLALKDDERARRILTAIREHKDDAA